MAIVTSINFHGKGSGCSLRFLTRQIITLFYIFVLAFIITVHGQISNAQFPYMCNFAYNYTNGSKFESNLNTVLNNLVRGALQTGFNTSVYGQIPEQIYGLLQCNGDATTQQCYNCSQKAIPALRQVCGNSMGGRVWLEDCYLRYENGTFFGKLNDDAKYVYSSQNVSSPGVFEAALERLLNNLSGDATSGSGYASGKTIDSLSRKIYGAVQCWKDISTDDCTKCLLSTINTIVTYYAGSQGVEGLIGSCKVRYETYSFFHSTAPPPSPAEAPSISEPKQITPSSNTTAEAPANTTQINYSGKASDRIPAIVGGALGSLLFVLVVCLFTCWRRLKSAIFRRQHEDPNKRADLDWQKRYNIILGIARGLLYLHQDSQLRIVHRDIKASNILLDEKLNPKIADFGLAKLFPEDETQINTGIAGTLGYMAPEYAMRGQLSVKVDVYSFGVVLLEVVSGRKNTDHNLSSEMEMLLGWVWSSYKRGNIVQMIDPAIIETCDEDQAARCIHVGLLCTQADSSLRPSMSTVTLMLSAHSVALPDPTKPAYVTSVTHNTDSTGSRSGLSHGSPPTSSSVSSFHIPVAHLSIADASITILEPR